MRLQRICAGQFAVHAVCDNRGRCELVAFLEGLGAKLRAHRDGMLYLLDRCASHGPPANAEQKHHLGDGIYELIRGPLRVLFFTDQGRIIICSHGIIKKTGKVPKRDIIQATAARDRYRAARDRGQLQIMEDNHDAQPPH